MSRTVIICIIIFMSYINIHAENDESIFIGQTMENYRNYPTVFLDLEYTGNVILYENDRLISLKNNDKEENFILFSLLKKNGCWFEVVAWNSIDESYIGKGRIPASTPISIYSNNYTPETNPLKLYVKPTTDSPYIEDRLYTAAGFAVVDVYEKWLKIKISMNNNIYFVWLAPHNQCANVYSTCS